MNMEQKYSTDFIERTQKLLEQYDKLFLKNSEKFEVTLLLNACVGLLIICTEKYDNKLPTTVKGFNEIKAKTTKCLSKKLNSQTINVRNTCRHLRNSIAHCKFKTNNGKDKKIESITFRDFLNRDCKPEEQTFEAKIPINILKEFLIDLSTQTINKIKQAQTTTK